MSLYDEVDRSGRDEARHYGIESDRPTASELAQDEARDLSDDPTITPHAGANGIDVKALRSHPRSVTSRSGLSQIASAWRIFRNGIETDFMVIRCSEGLAIVDNDGRKVTEWAQDGRMSPLKLARLHTPARLF